MTPKVSVVVTIYNREKYIEKCARSLFEQTLQDVEFVFVDDASSDHSVELLKNVLEDYPNRSPLSKIVCLDQNGGVANARNVGIDNVTGEYVIHADSDDWVDTDMYERLYQKAVEADADVVGCNLCQEHRDRQYVHKQPYAETVDENLRRLINGELHPSLCTSLVRASVIKVHHISFPKGLNMGEDLYFNLLVYLYSKTIVSMDFAPYHYRHDEDSSSFHISRKSIDNAIKVSKMIEERMREMGLYDSYKKEIEFRKFSMKFAMIWNFKSKENYKEWLDTFPETHKYIWSFKQIEWKLRLELWFAAHHMFFMSKAIKKGLDWQYRLRHP